MHLITLSPDGSLTRAEIADPFKVGTDGPTLHPGAAAGMVLVDEPNDTDVWALGPHWQRLDEARRAEAHRWFDRAEAAGAAVMVWTVGDLETALDHPAVIRFQLAGSRRRPSMARRVEAYPPFIDDELTARSAGAVIRNEPSDRPRVGFCGQGQGRASSEAKLLASKLRCRVHHAAGRSDLVPEPWPSHLRLRNRTLTSFAANPGLETNFVIRDQYRAGLRTKAERRDPDQLSRIEFFDNLAWCDFALCIRGGGNFSVRLFEALCFGRIPVVVDSGGRLPLEDDLDWDSVVIRMPQNGEDELAQRVIDTHQRLGPDGIYARQLQCRQLWVDRLSRDGFMAELPRLLDWKRSG